MRISKTLFVTTIFALSVSGSVFAKGHDQRTDRGATAITTTACSAFTLGQGKGPSGNPAISC